MAVAASVKERPIPFRGDMVLATLEDRKRQTRRLVVANQPIPSSFERFEMRRDPVFGAWVLGPAGFVDVHFFQVAHGWANGAFGRSRYGVPGERLWVRETWRPDVDGDVSCVAYRADGAKIHIPDTREAADRWLDVRRPVEQFPTLAEPKWRPPRFMPRWASRILLEVVAVRAERLQAISCSDIRAEGVRCPEHDGPGVFCSSECAALRGAFAELWDSINGERAPWESDPWVRVVAFTRLQPHGQSNRGERRA